MSELVQPWKGGAQTPPEKLMLPVYCAFAEHTDHDASDILTSVGKIFHSDCQRCHKCLKQNLIKQTAVNGDLSTNPRRIIQLLFS